MKHFYTEQQIEKIKKEIEDRLLSQREVIWKVEDIARELGWSASTVQNKISKREIPYHRVSGKTTLFLKSEIIKWIQNDGDMTEFLIESVQRSNKKLMQQGKNLG